MNDGAANLGHEVHYGRPVRCHAERPSDLHAMFMATVTRAPEATALVDGDERWSYCLLAERVGRCVVRLSRLGLVAGDRLALMLENRADYLTLLLAAARLGIICVPMNIRQRSPETAYALCDSGAVAIIHENALADGLPDRGEAPGVRHWLPFAEEARCWATVSADAVSPPPDRAAVVEDDPFCILYTSGTTGCPKGAVLTHFGLVTNCIGAQEHLGLTDGEVQVLSVPASHVTGLMLVLLLSVRLAGKVVIQRAFKARPFLELAEREGMSFAIMVPAMYTLCLMEPDYDRFRLDRWRVGAYGGAPVAEATIVALAERTPQLTLVNIYGSTETTSPAVMMPLGEGGARPDQVGRALPYCDLIVVDENGRELPHGEQGEIWIAGPMTVPRYWNNAEATAAGFSGGYWKSGDIGIVDADGYLQVLDRKKDMINRGGFKVYSVEVENVLLAHDDVAEAVVVGRPCPVLGERVEAFVVVRSTVEAETLRHFCADRLSDYKVPDHVCVVEGPLPRNPNGKLLKNVVREWLAA